MVSPIAALNPSNLPVNQASGAGSFQQIKQAIKQASARTGVDFSYLLNKASQESNFNPNAKAAGSSATGLFQFTSQTWLQTVKTYGSQYGLSQYANHISTDSNGVDHVTDPNWRTAILSLRKDPTVSAEMAGSLDKQNLSALQDDVGGKIGPTELYLAHFIGAGGASSFIDKLRTNPSASAASVLPQAAAANPSVFYDKSGAARSVGSIYKQFAQKFDNPANLPSGTPTTMVASAVPLSSSPSTSTSSSSSRWPSTTFSTAAAANTLAQASSYMPSVVNTGVKSTNSSLYATMVLAQMDTQKDPLTGMNAHTGSGRKRGAGASDMASAA